MNKFLTNLAGVGNNPHVSIPLLIAIACEFGPIWLPQYTHQFHVTSKIFTGYGTLAAANSIPSLPTGPLKKSYETRVLDLVDNMKATPELIPEVPKPSTNT